DITHTAVVDRGGMSFCQCFLLDGWCLRCEMDDMNECVWLTRCCSRGYGSDPFSDRNAAQYGGGYGGGGYGGQSHEMSSFSSPQQSYGNPYAQGRKSETLRRQDSSQT